MTIAMFSFSLSMTAQENKEGIVSEVLSNSLLWWILGIALAFVTLAILIWGIITLLKSRGIIDKPKKQVPYSLNELRVTNKPQVMPIREVPSTNTRMKSSKKKY